MGSNRIATEEALSGSHVLIPHSGVFFLTGCVENIEKTSLVVDCDLLSVRILNSWVLKIEKKEK